MKATKKAISLLLVLVMVVSMIPAAAATGTLPFTDVNRPDWFYDAVRYVYEEGLMSGTSATTFTPNGTTTRGMIVTILHRLEGKPVAYGESFADVSANAYYADAVAWAGDVGIVTGYSNGCFGPNDAITRQQLAAILFRYAGFCGKNTVPRALLSNFADSDSVADYAVDAMQWAVAEDLIKGSDGYLNPNGLATRAQVATILERFCNVGGSIVEFLPGFIDCDDNNDKEENDGVVTVRFDLGFEADYVVENQVIESGELVSEPAVFRENHMLIGWHEKGTNREFDFSNSVYSNMELMASWIDLSDRTDTDGEGLIDVLEDYYGTNKHLQDTDGDGLNDYLELDELGTDPLKQDTDSNAITDNLEDADADGLCNEEEVEIDTNATYYDTDHDFLSDYDEVYVYHTDPLLEDTDSDGVNDGDEIAIGSDPFAAETTFITQMETGEPTEEVPVTVSVSALTDAEGAGTLEINPVTHSENYLVSERIAGYLGCAYDFETNGQLENAEVSFLYDESLGEVGETFQPRVYFLNEETQEYEELPNQTVENGKVTVKLSHFSTYILLNKVEFDKVWDNEIKAPGSGDQVAKNLSIVFVIDDSGSMDGDRVQTVKTVMGEFIDSLGEEDRAAIVKFTSGARLLQPLTSDKTDLKSAVDRLQASGGTDIDCGVLLGIEQLEADDGNNSYDTLILLTDGQDSSFNSRWSVCANQCKDLGIVAYSIGIGSGVSSNHLTSFAEATGGKYYHAKVAGDLADYFDDLKGETIDFTTDSNEDGLSDYYTALINSGDLPVTNSAAELAGCLSIFGADCADWDGDGRLNGEEITVIMTAAGSPAVYMISHPFFADIDGDGLNDSEEYALGTDYFNYTFDQLEAYETLTERRTEAQDDADFSYDDLVEQVGLTVSASVLDSTKKEIAAKVLIDYFYDFASQESINNNAERIEKLAKQTSIISGIDSLVNIASSIEGMVKATGGVYKLSAANEKAQNFGFNVYKSLGEIYKCTNENDLDKALDLTADALDAAGDGAEIVLEEWELEATSVSEALETTADVLGAIEKGLGIYETVMKFVAQDGKMLKMDLPAIKGFKKFAKSYKDWTDEEIFKDFDRGQAIGIAFDAVELAADSAVLYTTYAKIQANVDAYVEYIEIIEYISENGNNVRFVQDAAGSVAKMVVEDGGEVMEEYWWAVGEKSVKAVISTASDVLLDHPYAEAIKSAVTLGIKVAGLDKAAEATFNLIAADAITDACLHYVDVYTYKDGANHFSTTSHEEARKYLSQLAQSRIYTEDTGKKLLEVRGIVTVLAEWIGSWLPGVVGPEEALGVAQQNILDFYGAAHSLGLTLSRKLPEYSTFYSQSQEGGGGDALGGGSSGGR